MPYSTYDWQRLFQENIKSNYAYQWPYFYKQESEVFYLIAYVDPPTATSALAVAKKFTTEAEAQKAADELANSSKRDVFVLKTITKAEPPRVKVTRL